MSRAQIRQVISGLIILLSLSACGGGGGGSSPATTTVNTAHGSNSSTDISGFTVQDVSECAAADAASPNVVPVCVDNGPDPAQVNVVNEPYVTVTLCVPGSTTQCVTVDHVLVDTGSTGLRVAVEALGNQSLPLPAVKTSTGSKPIAECYQYVSGWTWGSLNKADVYVGGMVARSVPIHMLGYSSANPSLGGAGGGAFPHVPASCSGSNANGNMNSVSEMGANAILGLSTFDRDCDGCDTATANNQYFTCTAIGACTSVAVPLTNQPGHLGLYFSSAYANGVSLTMPTVSGVTAAKLQGTLTFGVPSLPEAATQLVLNQYGQFTISYNGQTYSSGFIDSGSNALFFDSTAGIGNCTYNTGFYCPTSAVTITATNADGNGHSSTFSMALNNIDALMGQLGSTAVIVGLAGPVTGSTTDVDPTFDLGFPFFIGRTVYVVRQGTAMGSAYGVVAYTP